MWGHSKRKEEVNSIVKGYFVVSSFPHLTPEQKGKVCGLLGVDEGRGP